MANLQNNKQNSSNSQNCSEIINKMVDRNTEAIREALNKLIAQNEKALAQNDKVQEQNKEILEQNKKILEQNEKIVTLNKNLQEQNKLIVDEILSLLRPVSNQADEDHQDSGTKTPSPEKIIQKSDIQETFLSNDIEKSVESFKKAKRYEPPRKSPIVT